ncbi:tRNA modification GTPase [Acetoanaerobium pronyense]|uniref:tRNA modification GTPase MnmE n=1 Tax=Acetoanaerobium pronyense TaxID=1482736 RepID=A0ABS4KL89_9FIRM|nr:tRNA uridine-5-carboxymethylaminomethyl(34) synthesis GTPase MnmE [Acetoanaerobium pronyense]MBP2028557.1 tRNA modification GTPase [Acetoanaerobium pronyense]
MYIDDTIAAVATAPGEAGIGIVRISGPNSLDIANTIFRPVSKNINILENPRKLIYGHIIDKDIKVDEVLLSFMKGPHTFTREDIVEINCHGGYISVRKILELVIKSGARIADRGEFTKRAFLNGRIDLSQAEATMDIITSKTSASFDIAQKQLEGKLSSKIKEIRDILTLDLAKITVAIDFPEEDEPEVTYEELLADLKKIKDEIHALILSFDKGKIMRDGLKTVIVGKPNVGKSSLLNAILKESRAIVTEIAGTTRDIIEEYVNIGGIPLRIVDTAGIRETEDIVEKIGVQKSKESIESADLVIMMLDSSRELTDEDIEILTYLDNKKSIILMNKTDLAQAITDEDIEKHTHGKSVIKISALENKGIEEIEKEIEKMVYEGELQTENDIMVTNARHKNSLEKAYTSCCDAIDALDSNIELDIAETDFKIAWDSLGQITGDTVSEDLLDTIFREFCIGK